MAQLQALDRAPSTLRRQYSSDRSKGYADTPEEARQPSTGGQSPTSTGYPEHGPRQLHRLSRSSSCNQSAGTPRAASFVDGLEEDLTRQRSQPQAPAVLGCADGSVLAKGQHWIPPAWSPAKRPHTSGTSGGPGAELNAQQEALPQKRIRGTAEQPANKGVLDINDLAILTTARQSDSSSGCLQIVQPGSEDSSSACPLPDAAATLLPAAPASGDSLAAFLNAPMESGLEEDLLDILPAIRSRCSGPACVSSGAPTYAVPVVAGAPFPSVQPSRATLQATTAPLSGGATPWDTHRPSTGASAASSGFKPHLSADKVEQPSLDGTLPARSASAIWSPSASHALGTATASAPTVNTALRQCGNPTGRPPSAPPLRQRHASLGSRGQQVQAPRVGTGRSMPLTSMPGVHVQGGYLRAVSMPSGAGPPAAAGRSHGPDMLPIQWTQVAWKRQQLEQPRQLLDGPDPHRYASPQTAARGPHLLASHAFDGAAGQPFHPTDVLPLCPPCVDSHGAPSSPWASPSASQPVLPSPYRSASEAPAWACMLPPRAPSRSPSVSLGSPAAEGPGFARLDTRLAEGVLDGFGALEALLSFQSDGGDDATRMLRAMSVQMAAAAAAASPVRGGGDGGSGLGAALILGTIWDPRDIQIMRSHNGRRREPAAPAAAATGTPANSTACAVMAVKEEGATPKEGGPGPESQE